MSIFSDLVFFDLGSFKSVSSLMRFFVSLVIDDELAAMLGISPTRKSMSFGESPMNSALNETKWMKKNN